MSIRNIIHLNNLKKFFTDNKITDHELDPDQMFNLMYSTITLDELDKYINNDSLTPTRIQELSDLFEIEKIINPINKTNCICVSFFAQYSNNKYPNELGKINILDVKSNWYNKYYVNILKFIESFKSSKFYHSFKLRIYLEQQLKNLIPNLSDKNIEIYLMKNNSIGLQPGALWRFTGLSDKTLNNAFCFDIDENFNSYSKYINSFIQSQKSLGRTFQNYNRNIKVSNSVYNHPIVSGCIIATKPQNIDLDFKEISIKYIIYRMIRSTTDFPHLEHDSDLTSIYNKPIDKHIYGWGGHWNMYGFDERIWKHILFPYFVKKSEVLSWAKNINKNLFYLHPCSIDYKYCTKYNNEFIII